MDKYSEIEINGVPIKWNTTEGTFTFFGLKSALFWINPSLLTLLQPIEEEIGQDLFKLMIANSASQGTNEDYQSMVTVLGKTFEEGFSNWGKAVSSAGWGTFELTAFDETNKTASIRISNTWELLLGNDSTSRWGCPFIQGKLIGIFSQAFNKSCWADEIEISYDPDNSFVEYSIHESDKTISTEIDALRLAKMRQKERKLAIEINRKTLALHNSENRFRQLAELSSDWVWEMDKDFKLSYFSDAYFRQTGYDPIHSIGKTRSQLTPASELEKPHWKKHLEDLNKKREFRNFQYEFIGPDGKKLHLQISGSPVYDEKNDFIGYRGSATNITEKIESLRKIEAAKMEAEKNLEKVSELNLQLQTEVVHKNQALTRLSYVTRYDNLTEIPNRAQIKIEIQNLQSNTLNDQFLNALMYLNLNDIEQINLKYGLDVGDTVLVEASLLIKDTVREGDIVARSSGSDFIILLKDCQSVEVVEKIAQQVIHNLTQTFESVPGETINSSIGVSIFSTHLESIESLLSQTYGAMHEARIEGKKIVISS